MLQINDVYKDVPDTEDVSYRVCGDDSLLLRQPSQVHEWDFIALSKNDMRAVYNLLGTLLQEIGRDEIQY